jgi:hypothetical protein
MANLATQNWQESFFVAINTVVTNVVSYIPTILAAIIVFLTGLFLSRFLKSLTIKVLKAVQLPKLAEKVGLEKVLEKTEVETKVEEIVGEVVKWLVLLVFVVAAVNILGLSTVSLVLNSILNAIPRVVSAVLILAIAVLLAGVVENLIKGSLAQINVKTARLLAKIGSYIVVIFGALAALNELGIAQSFVNAIFIGVIAALSLGFGLALGLGGKDTVSKMLEEWYKEFKKDSKKK